MAGGPDAGQGSPVSANRSLAGGSRNGAKNRPNHGASQAKPNGSVRAAQPAAQASLTFGEDGPIAPEAATGGTLTDLSEQFAAFQEDAPSCDQCGAITVRNGNCYLCHVCGNSMGCS